MDDGNLCLTARDNDLAGPTVTSIEFRNRDASCMALYAMALGLSQGISAVFSFMILKTPV